MDAMHNPRSLAGLCLMVTDELSGLEASRPTTRAVSVTIWSAIVVGEEYMASTAMQMAWSSEVRPINRSVHHDTRMLFEALIF